MTAGRAEPRKASEEELPAEVPSVELAEASEVPGASLCERPTDVQLRAIELLCAGVPETQVREEVHVSRTKMWRWRTQDPAFMEAYEAQRSAIASHRKERLFALHDLAVDVIEENLQEGDPDLALAVLRMSLSREVHQVGLPQHSAGESE
jgi:hypothetical protein